MKDGFGTNSGLSGKNLNAMDNNQPHPSRAAQCLLIVGLVLVVNSAYLAAFGDPNLFYVINALLHPLLGLAAGILLAIFLTRNRQFLAGVVAAVSDRLPGAPG